MVKIRTGDSCKDSACPGPGAKFLSVLRPPSQVDTGPFSQVRTEARDNYFYSNVPKVRRVERPRAAPSQRRHCPGRDCPALVGTAGPGGPGPGGLLKGSGEGPGEPSDAGGLGLGLGLGARERGSGQVPLASLLWPWAGGQKRPPRPTRRCRSSQEVFSPGMCLPTLPALSQSPRPRGFPLRLLAWSPGPSSWPGSEAFFQVAPCPSDIAHARIPLCLVCLPHLP